MRFLLLIISPFVMLLFSCESRQYINNYANRIDSLSQSLEASASLYESIDTAEISKQLQLISEQYLLLTDQGTTNPSESVQRIKTIKKGFEEFLTTNPSLCTEVDYARSQLLQFKHDLQKEYLTEKNASIYFEQEKQSVHVVQLKIAYQIKLVNLTYKKYEVIKTDWEN